MFIDIKSILNNETAPMNAKRAQTTLYTIRVVWAEQDTTTIENTGVNVNASFKFQERKKVGSPALA